MDKRVLIITYYWPPSGGSGVQRWLKFAKYLPESGWEPVIFTPENPDFDLKDETLLEEIPKNLEVLKFPIWEPYQLLAKLKGRSKTHPGRIMEQKQRGFLDKMAIWLRANLLVPDPRIFWVRPSVKFLEDLIQKGQFQAIITTGPPHSMHLIGRDLKRKTGIFWLADFRDPWSEWEFLDKLPMQSRVKRKHAEMEKSVLKEADIVTTISPTFQQELSSIANSKVHLLTNGYDPADLPEGFGKATKNPKSLKMVYTGVIDSIRNPIPILEAMKEEFEDNGEKVTFDFVGNVSEQVRSFVSEDPWLQSCVNFPGYVSHHEVFDFYAKADLLVLILTDTKNAKGNIPGKLFEYLATGLPILALGDPVGDSSKILAASGAGKVLNHMDAVKIQLRLRDIFEQGEVGSTAQGIEQYSRKNLSVKLAQLLDESSIS